VVRDEGVEEEVEERGGVVSGGRCRRCRHGWVTMGYEEGLRATGRHAFR